jgi:putative DNA methylase
MLEWERQRLEQQPMQPGQSTQERNLQHAKLLFVKRDQYLDTAQKGPMYLKDPSAAQLVVESVVWGVPDRYDLLTYAVMPNHVHVLLTPRVELEVITQGIKGYTAHEINGLQHQRGRVFWQDESFDHWARDFEELCRIIDYIEHNPVKAGLCQCPEHWPWSAAHWRERLDWKVGDVFRAEWKTLVGSAWKG